MKSTYCATVVKPTAASSLGMHLWSPPYGGAVLVVNLDDHGLFARKLKVGLQIDYINEHCCQGMTVHQVQAYLDDLVGKVTIWASAPQPLVLGAPRQRYVGMATYVPVVTKTPTPCQTLHLASQSLSSSSPPPSVTEISDDADSFLSLDSISLENNDYNSSCRHSVDEDDKMMMDLDYNDYYGDCSSKSKPPNIQQQQHRVGPLFDAVMDFLL